MQIGTDLDGVISVAPLRFGLLKAPFIYLTRKPFPEIVSFLQQAKDSGHEIIIISGIPRVARPIVKWWLKRHSIPHDRLILRKFRKDIAVHKAEQISKNKCQFFVEDDLQIVQKLMELLEVDKIERLLSGHGNGIFVLSFRWTGAN